MKMSPKNKKTKTTIVYANTAQELMAQGVGLAMFCYDDISYDLNSFDSSFNITNIEHARHAPTLQTFSTSSGLMSNVTPPTFISNTSVLIPNTVISPIAPKILNSTLHESAECVSLFRPISNKGN